MPTVLFVGVGEAKSVPCTLDKDERARIVAELRPRWRRDVFSDADILSEVGLTEVEEGPNFDPARSSSCRNWIKLRVHYRLLDRYRELRKADPLGHDDWPEPADEQAVDPADVGESYLDEAQRLAGVAHPKNPERVRHLVVAIVAIAYVGRRLRANAGPAELRAVIAECDLPPILVDGQPAVVGYMRGLLVECLALVAIASVTVLRRTPETSNLRSDSFRRWWEGQPPDQFDTIPAGFPDDFIEAVLQRFAISPDLLVAWDALIDELPNESWLTKSTRRRRDEMRLSVQYLVRRIAQYLYARGWTS